MKTSKIKLICAFMIILSGVGIEAFAQEEEKEFIPSGKPFVQIFSDFKSDFTDGDISTAMEIKRAYIGYSYKLSKEFSMKMNLDVAKPVVDINDSTSTNSSLHYTAFLKNALIVHSKMICYIQILFIMKFAKD